MSAALAASSGSSKNLPSASRKLRMSAYGGRTPYRFGMSRGGLGSTRAGRAQRRHALQPLDVGSQNAHVALREPDRQIASSKRLNF